MSQLRVLVVDDDASIATRLDAMLREGGLQADCSAASGEAGFVAAVMGEGPPHIVLVPHRPGFGAAEALAVLATRSLEIPLVALVPRSAPARDERWQAVSREAADLASLEEPWRLAACLARALERRREIRERIQQEQKIARLSRIQSMLSGISSAIVRMRDRTELLREACRIAIEHGRVQFAVIGLIDEKRELRNVVWNGSWKDPEIFSRYVIDVDDPSQQGQLLTALRTGRTQVDNDARVSAGTNPAAAMAMAQGFHSSIVLPLMIGTPIGAIVLWTSEPGFFTDDEVRILETMAADVSFALESMHKAERADYLAFHDELTGLPNRNLFQERLGQYLRTAEGRSPVPVALFDLERFRFVNESHGRQAGDELLREVAQRLRGMLQGEQGQHVQEIARIGMNSFGIVLRGVRDADQTTIAVKELLRLGFAEPFAVSGEELRVRARCGVAMFPSDGADGESLLRNAEAALTNAKRSADSFTFYARAMNVHAADVLALENKLRRAIEQGEFVLHYQPKVSLLDRRMTGVEALIRWQDPESGLVPPARFIPILEETGMIFEVGRWALQQAISDYKRWVTEGLHAPRIAVNISPLQLRHRDFIPELRRFVAEHADAAVGLDIEITESVLMEDFQQNVQTLQAIRDLGINVAIDDFGTGYSSLSYLARLPASTLKIDRSFVVDMTHAPQGFAIVSTIISLAHSLNLQVVAEGVETEEQAKFLRVLNCDEIQGYLIARPMPVEQLERRLEGLVAEPILG